MSEWGDSAYGSGLPNFTIERDWDRDALCRQIDPSMFDVEPHDHQGMKQAKQVCQMCPVITDCLSHALEHREPWGVWGGMSARQRLRMQRVERIPRRCKICNQPCSPEPNQVICSEACRVESKRRRNLRYTKGIG